MKIWPSQNFWKTSDQSSWITNLKFNIFFVVQCLGITASSVYEISKPKIFYISFRMVILQWASHTKVKAEEQWYIWSASSLTIMWCETSYASWLHISLLVDFSNAGSVGNIMRLGNCEDQLLWTVCGATTLPLTEVPDADWAWKGWRTECRTWERWQKYATTIYVRSVCNRWRSGICLDIYEKAWCVYQIVYMVPTATTYTSYIIQLFLRFLVASSLYNFFDVVPFSPHTGLH